MVFAERATGHAGDEAVVQFKTMVISPEVAARFMEKNHPKNRPVSRAWVKRLSKMMSDGVFLQTHQAICFDEDGYLIDGQHRLSAVIHSGKTVVMSVCTGLNHAAFSAMDCGKGRTTSDRLRTPKRPQETVNALVTVPFKKVIRDTHEFATANYFFLKDAEAVEREVPGNRGGMSCAACKAAVTLLNKWDARGAEVRSRVYHALAFLDIQAIAATGNATVLSALVRRCSGDRQNGQLPETRAMRFALTTAALTDPIPAVPLSKLVVKNLDSVLEESARRVTILTDGAIS